MRSHHNAIRRQALLASLTPETEENEPEVESAPPDAIAATESSSAEILWYSDSGLFSFFSISSRKTAPAQQ